MAASLNFAMLVLGRAIIGVGSGAATVIVPLFLGEVAPASIKGSIGMLNQLGISFGLFVAVALGLPLSRPSWWRLVPVVSLSFAILQLLLAPLMPESPVWLANRESEAEPAAVESTAARSEEADTLGDEEQSTLTDIAFLRCPDSCVQRRPSRCSPRINADQRCLSARCSKAMNPVSSAVYSW